MNVSPAMQKTNAGTCPHGNPIGTCPICNGMSGGGGSSTSKPRRPGEMSYDQCYAIWQQMLKAKAAKEEAMHAQKLKDIAAQEMVKTFSDKIMDKISAITEKAAVLNAQNKVAPTLASRVQAFFLNSAVAVINIVQTVANTAQKVVNFVQQKIADISDKLAAIFGELKLAIKKRIKKFDFKTKLKSLFHIFNPLDIQNEEKKIDDEKLSYKIRTTLTKIKEKFNKKIKKG